MYIKNCELPQNLAKSTIKEEKKAEFKKEEMANIISPQNKLLTSISED